MPLFTIIFDFRGGTYISQIQSENEASAVVKWAEGLGNNSIQHLGAQRKIALAKELREFGMPPVALTGVRNVWCTSVNTSGGFGLINIVKTSEQLPAQRTRIGRAREASHDLIR